MNENKETIRVLLLEPDKRARIVTVQGDANSLRQALGGDFEPFHSLSENVCVLGIAHPRVVGFSHRVGNVRLCRQQRRSAIQTYINGIPFFR